MFGVTHIYMSSGWIQWKDSWVHKTIPIKNNVEIYENLFRLAEVYFYLIAWSFYPIMNVIEGLCWSWDYGTRYVLTMARNGSSVQELLAPLRTDPSQAPMCEPLQNRQVLLL